MADYDGPETPYTRFKKFASGGVFQSIVMLIIMRFVSYIDFTNERNLMIARSMYFVSFLGQIALLYILHGKVFRTKDFKPLTYFMPGSTLQQTEDKFVVTTNYDYDMEKIKDIAKAFFLPAIVMMFTHFRYGYVQPLVFQAILPWRQYWGMPIVRVHFLGAKAEGENKRPWKGGIDAMFSVVQPQAMTEKEYNTMKARKSKKSK